MIRFDTIDLITEHSGRHGVHDAVAEEARTVMCEIRSVKRTEYYNALNAGRMPEYTFCLALAEDYQGERFARYQGLKYRIIRSYITEDDGIELTAERSDVNGDE